MTYCEGAICHSLTPLLFDSPKYGEKLHIWPQKYKCVRHQKKFLLANTEEVFSVRYRILSLKIDSLPSNLHTKRIHSDGKTIYSKTDQGARKNFFSGALNGSTNRGPIS